MTEQEIRVQLQEAGVKLVESQLIQGTWGNLSIRVNEDYMLVTPSGLDYLRLTPDQMVLMNIHTLEYEGNIKPTSEKKIHAEIYKTRKEFNAVIHSHPIWCSVVAAARRNMPVMSEKMKELVGGDARVGKYGLPSTKKLTKGTMEAIKDRRAAFMANHGMVVAAEDMDKAFEVCRVMEDSSKLFIEREAMNLQKKTVANDVDLQLLFKELIMNKR